MTAPATTTTTFNPFDPATVANPYPHYDAMREGEQAPFAPLLNMYLFTRYDDVRALLRDEKSFSSQRRQAMQREEGPLGAGRTMLDSDPPDHTRLRKLVSRDFTPRTVAALEPRVREIVDGLFDERLRDGAIDVVGDLAAPLPTIVIAELLGIPSHDFEQFKHWSDAVIRMVTPLTPPAEAAETIESGKQLRAYLAGAVEDARQGRGQPGLIAQLVRAAEDGDTLSEDELQSFVVLLLLAGNETTTNLISNGALAMARWPEQRRWLAADLAARLPDAVEEFLRFDGPVQTTTRVVLQPASLHGVDLKPGDVVAPVLAAANRDPRKFEEPNRLDLSRTDSEHVGFGTWIHVCIGAPLARLESRVAFEGLLTRIPDFDVTIPESELRYSSSFALRGLKRLPIAAG